MWTRSKPFLFGAAGAAAVLLVVRLGLDYRDFLAMREQLGQVQGALSRLQVDPKSGTVYYASQPTTGQPPAASTASTTLPEKH